jgi:putative glutamine amidotransferase
MAAASERPPLIGITTSEVRRPVVANATPESEPPQPELVLGMPYVRALARSGAVPVVLPPLALELVPGLLAPLAGVCLSGGPDIDPASYGAEPHPELGPVEAEMDAFELAVARQADAAGLPVLGICRGAQTLNVVRGGTLLQHVPDHRQTEPGWTVTHGVEVEPGSRLARVLGAGTLSVNSFHHQAVERLGDGLRAVAWAPDGTIEGIEGAEDRLVLGVQWHAETLDEVERPQARLFAALVDAARDRAGALV